MNMLTHKNFAAGRRSLTKRKRHANDNDRRLAATISRAARQRTIPASMVDMTDAEMASLMKRGYATRAPMFDEAFADGLAVEIDRLIEAGVVRPAPDRIVNGVPTEWFANTGPGASHSNGESPFQTSPVLAMLYASIVRFGESFNRVRAQLIEAGAIRAGDVPELACEGVELNVNRVVGIPDAVWSGLHLHTDDTRFTPGLRALDTASLAHRAVRARVFTISGYARRRAADGSPQNDLGGALPFIIKAQGAGDANATSVDIVPAHHNTGAFFFPGPCMACPA